jgi:protocatechuate 3,4-dioxygenase beta subunit
MKASRVLTRRRALGSALALAALARPALAAGLAATPRQTPGPFYPASIPLDSDTDLVRVAGRPQEAAGQVSHLFGRILDQNGRPVPGVRVEIWQCDAFGRYHHPKDTNGTPDPNFQGYGQMAVGNDGAYRFRTIKPVPYPGRAPHVHFALSGAGLERLTTQMYVAGEPQNQQDWILNSVRDSAARASLIVDLTPAPPVELKALAGTFDIVLGGNTLKG